MLLAVWLAYMKKFRYNLNDYDAGWSSLEARRAHNPKVAGSNPAPATKSFCGRESLRSEAFLLAEGK